MKVLALWAVLAAIVQVVVILQYQRSRGSGWLVASLAGFSVLGCVLLTPVILQALLIGLVVAVAQSNQWRTSTFACVSTAATLSIFGLGLWMAYRHDSKQAELRQQYAYESMADRVPAPRIKTIVKELPVATLANLKAHEEEIGRGGYRVYVLQQLHEDHLETFVNSVGFGISRQIRPSEFTLKFHEPEKPLPQAGPAFELALSGSGLGMPPAETDMSSLRRLHSSGFRSFFNPDAFGYTKDRQHVAGFEPHGFREAPRQQGWKAQRVDLVGLLLAKEPVVYLTDGLPRMDQARKAPKRALDAFEEAGLHELQKGEDLFVRDTASGLRMLGALRALNQCMACHDCQRGDLLGAFTYCLVKAENQK